ncbi:uncharacterized protein LOC134245401 isoform X2 [Saccostrea cucullata]
MIWKKLFDGVYKDLAEFGEGRAYFAIDGVYLSNRSNLINPINGSTSFVLVINDVMCEDDGQYQCLVKYIDGVIAKQARNETTVFLQVGAEQPTNFELYKNDTLKEKDAVFLSCSANVGNPGGFVAIWKLNKLSNQLVLLNRSSEVNEKTDNCTAIANFNITYRVSRDDNGAIFRCISQNRQTQEPAPHKDTEAIDVQYGPYNVTIESPSSDQDLRTGANVNLTCISDGNPTPTFKWKFNSSNVFIDKRHSLTPDNRTLILKNMIFNDSGIYSCFVSNVVDKEMREISSNVSLKVNEEQIGVVETLPATCDKIQCQTSEICSVVNGIADCKVNHWFFVTIVFIFLTLLFMVTTIVGVRRNRLNNSSINFNGALKSSDHSKSKTNDYDFDGYSDPKDVTKLCQNTEKSESENVTYADPVDNQYASVQKNSTEPSKPPNVYDGAWV